jgi:hypothetical protein
MLNACFLRPQRWISWTFLRRCVSAAKVAAFIKNHYTKSYVINQHNYNTFFLIFAFLYLFSFSRPQLRSFNSPFTCLNNTPSVWGWYQKKIIPMTRNALYRFTINHWVFPLLLRRPTIEIEGKTSRQIYGAFLLSPNFECFTHVQSWIHDALNSFC